MSNPETAAAGAITKRPDVALALPGGDKFTVRGDAERVLLQRNGDRWQAEEIATLGESDMFVRRDEAGVARCFYRKVRLSTSKDRKELVEIEGKWSISAIGYEKLNQVAGVHVMTPQSILVDGREVANPHVQYSPTGELVRVIARKIAIGYSPIGNLVAVDAVRHYNFEAYFLQDLQNKLSKVQAAQAGTAWSCPFDQDAEVLVDDLGRRVKVKPADGGKSKEYVFVSVKGAFGIWVDPSHDEIRSVMRQHIQHQKFGDAIAQKLAWRNALKPHPAIATTNVVVPQGGNSAEVTVFAWKHDLTEKALRQLGEQVARGEQLANVEVRREEGEASLEELDAAAGEDADGDLSEAGGGGAAEAPADVPATAATMAARLQEIVDVAKAKGHDAAAIAQRLYKAKLEKLTPDQIARLDQVVASLAQGTPPAGAEKGGAV